MELTYMPQARNHGAKKRIYGHGVQCGDAESIVSSADLEIGNSCGSVLLGTIERNLSSVRGELWPVNRGHYNHGTGDTLRTGEPAQGCEFLFEEKTGQDGAYYNREGTEWGLRSLL